LSTAAGSVYILPLLLQRPAPFPLGPLDLGWALYLEYMIVTGVMTLISVPLLDLEDRDLIWLVCHCTSKAKFKHNA
jgi:hypothetical protein